MTRPRKAAGSSGRRRRTFPETGGGIRLRRYPHPLCAALAVCLTLSLPAGHPHFNRERDAADEIPTAAAGVRGRDVPAPAAKKRKPGSRLDAREIRVLLRLHNRARADVGVRPLVWSESLAACAQRWADHLAATGCRMEHRPSSGKWRRRYGENLFMGTAGAYGVGDAVLSWVDERKDYRGRALNGSDWSAAGHYTQVVWRDTRRVGCARKVCGGMVIVVCNYDPPGNVLGEKPY
jgi:pathogenesis-related protein 1